MIDNLTEAIAHAKELAIKVRKNGNYLHFRGNERIANECDECAADHEQLAAWLEELKQRREADRWIPVSERLPEEFGDYLVFTSEKEIDIGTFVPEFVNSWSMCNVDGFYWVKQKGIEITHWKPLPTPLPENMVVQHKDDNQQ